MMIPMMMTPKPTIFFHDIFSFKNSQLSTATKKYPEDSKIGPKDSGITVYAQMEHSVAPKKMR